MITRDRYLVGFSIATSLLSAFLGFIERFIQATKAIDYRIIFFSGLIILLVIMILVFFLVKEIIERYSGKRLRTVSRVSKKSKRKK